MRLTEETIGLWYVPGDDKDWLLSLFHDGDVVRGAYRFRYYRDDSEDRKNWYNIKVVCNNMDDVISNARSLFQLTQTQFGQIGQEFLRGDHSLEEFTHEILSADFVHMSIVSGDIS